MQTVTKNHPIIQLQPDLRTKSGSQKESFENSSKSHAVTSCLCLRQVHLCTFLNTVSPFVTNIQQYYTLFIFPRMHFVHIILHTFLFFMQVSLLWGDSVLSWRPCEAGCTCSGVCLSWERVRSVAHVCVQIPLCTLTHRQMVSRNHQPVWHSDLTLRLYLQADATETHCSFWLVHCWDETKLLSCTTAQTLCSSAATSMVGPLFCSWIDSFVQTYKLFIFANKQNFVYPTMYF